MDNVDRGQIVFFASVLFLVSNGLMLGIGIPAWSYGANTGGTGIVSNVTVEKYNVCRGQVSFTSDKGELVVAFPEVPCVPTTNATELPIDICYNWRNPHIVAYDNKLGKASKCSETGHNAAMRLIYASVILLAVYLAVVSAIACSCSHTLKDELELTYLPSANKARSD